MMAYTGGWSALVDFTGANKDKAVAVEGKVAWLLWRSAYFTMSVSFKNKILIPVYWFITWIFGRDVSKFE
jgi:NADH dehydrogenase FAD-containing subunit